MLLGGAAAAQGPAPCSKTMYSWNITGANTFWLENVSSHITNVSSVPFHVTQYYHHGGPLGPGTVPWYKPNTSTTSYQGHKWIWGNAGGGYMPLVWIGPCYLAWYAGTLRLFGDIDNWAPTWAMVEASADDAEDLTEDCYYWTESEGDPEYTACEQRAPGPGYEGGAGGTDVLECYEVWYVWYDDEGNIEWEEYAGYDLCFRDGLMT